MKFSRIECFKVGRKIVKFRKCCPEKEEPLAGQNQQHKAYTSGRSLILWPRPKLWSRFSCSQQQQLGENFSSEESLCGWPTPLFHPGDRGTWWTIPLTKLKQEQNQLRKCHELSNQVSAVVYNQYPNLKEKKSVRILRKKTAN